MVLFVGEKLWYHTNGTLYCTDQRRAIIRAAKEHNAFNPEQVCKLVESFGSLASPEAAKEIVRLMKNDPSTYGGLFRMDLPV